MTKKLKKPIAFLTVFAMLMAMLLYFPAGTFGGFDLGLRASAISLEEPEGWGSSDNPYLIDTAGKLYWFANYVNNGHPHSSARLTADIVVNRNVLDGGGNLKSGSFEQWTPIGSEENVYFGTFEGNGHTISGLYFNNPGAKNAGLFGVIGTRNESSTLAVSISYVGIVDSYFYGGNNIGSICGAFKSSNTNGTVKGCYSMGSVSGDSNVGGIVGNAEVEVENCYYLENRVSGAAASDASLATSAEKFTNGEVAYKLNKYFQTPVWGMNIGVDPHPTAVTVTDGLCGANKVYRGRDGSYHNHASEFVACSDCGAIAAVKPTLNSEGIYEINNKNELYWFSLYVNSGEGALARAILKDDIILNENVLKEDRTPNSGPFFEWVPIGSKERQYNGEFNGDGYRVSGVYIDRPNDQYLGLFGYINGELRINDQPTGAVKNVGVIDSYLRGNKIVGGLVGHTSDVTTRCYSTATVVGNNKFCASYQGDDNSSGWDRCCYTSDIGTGEHVKTLKQFANGDAAYYLAYYGDTGSKIWGQKIGVDKYPVHLTEANRVFFANDTYHNHDVDSDYCSVCKTILAVEPQKNANNEYEISNKGELLWFAQHVNAGNYTASAVLTADIVVNDKVFDDDGNVLPDLLTIPVMGSYTVTSISTKDNPFLGSFIGDGHTISGLYYSETSTNRIGLIGYAGSSAQISGVRITNSYIEGAKAVGAVCGLNAGGTISECSTDGCVITGTDVGGICGCNERSTTGGTITNCFNASKVIGDGAGGICGFNNSSTRDKLTNCINIGALYGGVENTCGTGFGSNCYVLTKNPLASPSDTSIASSIVGLTDDNFISTNRFGSEWTKTANDTANKKLYFPRLAAFSGSDISVEYTPKLVLENTNTTPVYYKDDVTFTFDAVLTLSNGEEYSAAGADTVLALTEIDFKIVHNNNPNEYDMLSTSFDILNQRLVLKIGGHEAGYIYVDSTTHKIKVEITEDINAGSHTFTITYDGTRLPMFTGLSVSYTVNVLKATPDAPALPSASDISYGEQLAKSELLDASGNTDTVWQWQDETIVPKVSETTQKIVTKNAVDDVNYDYSNIDGYNASTHLITKDITLTISPAVPTIVVTATPSAAIPGETVTVTAAISNPNNSALNDLPSAAFSYIIGTGSEQAITDGSFVIPNDTESGTVITIIARTSATVNYASATNRSTTVTVTDCKHTNKALKYDENSHWYHCDKCGANIDVEAHKGGTATCMKKAVCTVCKQEYGTVDPNNHKNVASTWSSDATGHWHECSDCHAKVDKAAHVSSGPATADKAEICTVCGYVIAPKLGTVADPVILPAEQTFKDSLEITITCGTEGSDIYYTLDGTTPTISEENRYTGPITITQTTTVKAIAVKFGMANSSVVSVKYTKKSSGGGGGYVPSRPVTPTETLPSIDGNKMPWNEMVDYIKKAASNTFVVGLNGLTEVPENVIKAIADRDSKVTFLVDGTFSWVVDGAEITAPQKADFTVNKSDSVKSDGLRGSVGTKFSANGTSIPAKLTILFKALHAGKFANAYKNVDGKLTFAGCAKIGEDGSVILPNTDGKGEYVVMICEFSDLLGDMNNDGVLSAADASAILKQVVGLANGKNPAVADMNGDGKVNAADASEILKRIVGLA